MSTITTPDATKKTTIKLLSYNLFMRPPGINEKGKDDMKDSRQRIISEMVIPDYDIICFQELFTKFNTRRRRILHSAWETGIKYASKPPEPDFWSIHLINSGLLNLSRYKIIKTEFRGFHNYAGVDSLALKGVLYSKINIQGEILHLFNTHLQASYGDCWAEPGQVYKEKYNVQARLNQMIELRNFISETLLKESLSYKKIIESPDPDEYSFEDTVIICGDFNAKSTRNLPKMFEKIDNKEARNWIEGQEGNSFIEYKFMEHVLTNYGRENILDLNKISYDGIHPETSPGSIGNGNEEPIEEQKLQEALKSTSGGIDYFFQLLPNNKNLSRINPINDLKCCKIRPFKVNYPYFSQLSDHYAVEIKLELDLAKKETDFWEDDITMLI